MNSKSEASADNTDAYKVVALKYRPQSFGDLVGQGHIATALSNAIDKNRVGHAYLFTGARGVGKTSSARIFAKCLNCETGPTKEPCGKCDICEAVSAGEDVDVLEIDGASNRGIDEIRQLRSNAAVRPSRCKYKIYIIDEVHMLTMQAFNALLKTLEEPPGHVKFIFCTTDPQKIPITVLSRCQRFDFSPVQTDKIADRLREIATNEGVTADEQALALLARRANGSMRDSQSLLEQLFSFCGTEISIDEVHQLLGTADMGRIGAIATAMANGDPTETLNLIHRGMTEGVDAGQMADQLLGYFRDMMAVRVGCREDTLLNCTAADMEHLNSLAENLGLETILTIVQLLDSAVVRMQSSLHSRTLLEAAAIRICNLEKLDAISDLVNSLAKGGAKATSARRAPASSRSRVEMRQVDVKKPAAASKKNDVVSSSNGTSESSGATQGSGEGDSKSVGTQSASKDPGSMDAATQPGIAADPAVGQSAVATLAREVSPSVSGSNQMASSQTASSQTASSQTASSQTPAVAKSDSATNSLAASTVSSTESSISIEKHWDQMLEEMGDMTADMASDYHSLEMSDPDRLVVTLTDTVNRDLCAKPERNKKFEVALEKITGKKIRVDFMATKVKRAEQAVSPKLTRVQQIRKLQEISFVKETLSLFDAEITGYHEPVRTKST